MYSPGFENANGHSTPPPLGLPGVFTISNPLQQALVAAARDLPPTQSTLNRANLLLAIARGKGSGANFMRYALTMTVGENGNIYNPKSLADLAAKLEAWQGNASAEVSGGDLTLDGRVFPISVSLRDLLAISRQYASAQPIETGDVVAADASSPNSILVPIFQAWGAEAAGPLLPRYAGSDFSKRLDDLEDGAVALSFQNSGAVAIPTAEHAVDHAPTPAATGRQTLRDLLAEAKSSPDRTVVRPELADNLIEALDQSAFLVIVTPRTYESEAAIRDLAALIASDDGGVLSYKNLLEPDGSDLNASPYSTLSAALGQGAAGIVYVPNLQDYLDDGNVSGLVQKASAGGQVKLITCMSDTAWKTEQGKPIYRRAHAILPPAPRVEEIRQIFLLRKTDLAKQYSPGNLQIAISDQAIGELAKLTAKYPVDPLELLSTAFIGIRMSESQGLKKIQTVPFEPDRRVDPVDIDLALRKLTGIVVSPEDPEKYLHMEEELKKWIIDQDQAIHVVSEAIITALGGIKDPKRPTGAFIFMGPTGVGKTEMARALARFLFNDANAILRFDMSEYMEKHEAARLVGAPPGYVGYEEGGQLTEAVRRKPYSIVLFDEFEKAHPDVMNTTLQILEEGTLTDGKGQATDFSNTLIIFTGNVGAEAYQLIGQTDSDGKEITEARVKDLVRADIRKTFRPEFLNRIGDENAEQDESNIVIFNTLKREDMLPIEEIELAKMNRLLAENGITVTVSDELKAQLAQEGYSQQYGARPLVRLIKRKLGFPLAQKTLRGEFKSGDKITASLVNGQVVLAK
ncbi:MAG: AAA family ATPase [Anaerolineae bacterium]